MPDKLDINSIFSVGLSKETKKLIAEIISLNISIEKLLDVLIEEKKIKKAKENTFYFKASGLPASELKVLIIEFNKIRNECAHKRMDKKAKVVAVLRRCRNIVAKVKLAYPKKYAFASRSINSPLQAAITVIFDVLASMYSCTTPRTAELDGLYVPGQKTLADEIIELIG